MSPKGTFAWLVKGKPSYNGGALPSFDVVVTVVYRCVLIQIYVWVAPLLRHTLCRGRVAWITRQFLEIPATLPWESVWRKSSATQSSAGWPFLPSSVWFSSYQLSGSTVGWHGLITTTVLSWPASLPRPPLTPYIQPPPPLICAPQWGAADAEIKVPSGENTELKRSPFKAWSRSVYSHACYAYCQGFLSCLFLHFQSIHLHFFQNLSWFFLCWLWLTHGSCVGPQNKLGHPAGCRFPRWVPAEYK